MDSQCTASYCITFTHKAFVGLIIFLTALELEN